jgi:hypothetical protein
MILLWMIFIVLNSKLIYICNLSLKHLVSAFISLIFLLLFCCLALASFMLSYQSIYIFLFLLLISRLLTINIQHIVIYLNRSIDPNYLPLKTNFHNIHINVYSVFVISLIWLVLRLLIDIYSHWWNKWLLLLGIHL